MGNRAGQNQLLENYLQFVFHQDTLTEEREAGLLAAASSGDWMAHNQLVDCYRRLVVQIAYRYHEEGQDLMDLIIAGNLELVAAARRYNRDVDGPLERYLAQRIDRAVAARKRESIPIIDFRPLLDLLASQDHRACT